MGVFHTQHARDNGEFIFHLQFTFQLHSGLTGNECRECVWVSTSSKYFLLKRQPKSRQRVVPPAAPLLLWGLKSPCPPQSSPQWHFYFLIWILIYCECGSIRFPTFLFHCRLKACPGLAFWRKLWLHYLFMWTLKLKIDWATSVLCFLPRNDNLREGNLKSRHPGRKNNEVCCVYDRLSYLSIIET